MNLRHPLRRLRRFLQTAWVVVGVSAGSLVALSAVAAEFPERAVTYIIPFGAGGESSVAANLQQPIFTRVTGEDLAITYQPGGGGAVVWDAVDRMPADGYTIIGINLPHIGLQPALGARYKTEELDAVYLFHYTPHAIIVSDDSEIESLEQLVEMARESPGRVSFSGSGSGTANHLAQVRFGKMAGISTRYEPYKGTAASITALRAERTMAAWAYTTVGLQYEDDVRVLAVAMEKRHPRLPDVPTFRELGYDIVDGAYRGIAVPPGTPDEVKARLSEVFAEINSDPQYVRRSETLGFALIDIPYGEANAFIQDKTKEYLELAREAGLLR